MTHEINDLKEFSEECLGIHEYGSWEYRLAEAYLQKNSAQLSLLKALIQARDILINLNQPIPVDIVTAISKATESA